MGTAKGNPVILARPPSESHRYDKAISHEAIHVQGKKFASGALSLDQNPKTTTLVNTNSESFATS
jgi:hypothetical protein